jgi:hypothetical protein
LAQLSRQNPSFMSQLAIGHKNLVFRQLLGEGMDYLCQGMTNLIDGIMWCGLDRGLSYRLDPQVILKVDSKGEV